MNLLQRLDAILRHYSTSEDDSLAVRLQPDLCSIDIQLDGVEYSIGFVLDDSDDDIIEFVQHALKARK